MKRGFIGLMSLMLLGAMVARAQTNTADSPVPATVPATNAPAAPFASDATPPPALNAPDPTNAVPPKPDDIEDIRPPFFFLHSWFWLWIGLAVTAAIALLVLFWFRFRPQRQLTPLSAYEMTLAKLEKARELLREENPMPYAIFVSETIRTYLGQRFASPSTRRTTEEFLGQMEADRSTPLAEHRDLLREFLQSCDLVKFARYQPTFGELEKVQQRAFNFVTATKPLPASSHDDGSQP